MTPTLGTRRLPIAVRPVPGESLRSIIEQAARAHQVPVHSLLGLSGAQVHTGQLLTRLDDDPASQQAAVAVLLGLTPGTVTAMTLRGIDDPGVVSWTDKGRAIHLGWGTVTAGRHCARCLSENGGRWLLAWRSPWHLLCRRHGVLLTTSCHACHQAPRGASSAPKGQVMPHGSRCSVPLPGPRGGRPPTLCRTDLTATSSVPQAGDYATAGQAYTDELRSLPAGAAPTTPAGDPATARDHLQDIRLLARYMHATVQPGDYDLTGAEAQTWQEWAAHRDRTSNTVPAFVNPRHSRSYRLPQTEAAAYAIAVGLAAAVVAAPDLPTARNRLRPAVRQGAGRGRGPGWRYAIKKMWQSEDAALWLVHALAQDQRT